MAGTAVKINGADPLVGSDLKEPPAMDAETLLLVQSPLDGRDVQVRKLREHPQFSNKHVVESLEDGFQWTHPLPTVPELTKVYSEDYNAIYGRDPSVVPPFVQRRAKAQLAFMQQHITGMAAFTSIGEAGAGWGQLSRAVMEFVPDAKVTTYELDHDSVKSMKESGIDARYGCMEIEETTEATYDLVMASHVTEHLLDPRGFYEKLQKLLKPDGYIFIEIPLENPVPQWWGTDPEKPYWVGHLHFFGRTHLQQMLESLDYKIVATSCHDHPHSAGFVNPGQEPYDVEAVPIEMDSEASKSESPKALRLLARKVL